VVKIIQLTFIAIVFLGAAGEGRPDELTYRGRDVAAWTRQLSDPDGQRRAAACRTLGHFGPAAKAAVPELVALLSDPEPDVARQSLHALACIGAEPERTVPALLSALTNRRIANLDPRAEIVADVTEGVRRFGKAAVPGLLDGLKGSPFARVTVLRILGRIGPEARDALPKVRELLADELAEVRAVAAWAAVNIDSGDEAGLAVLLTMLREKETTAGARLYEALAAYGPRARKATPELLKRLATLPREYPKGEIVQALARIGSDTPDIIPALLGAGRDVGPASRDVLRFQGEHVVLLLPDVRLSASPFERGDTVRLAASMRSDAVPPLVAVLKDPGRSAEDKVRALQLLTVLDHRTDLVIPALVEMLGHDRREVQTAAATHLGNLGPLAREAVPALQKWQKDGGSKELAVYSLAQIDPETPGVLPELLEWIANAPFPLSPSLRGYDSRAARAQFILGRLAPEKMNLLPALVAFWPKAKTGGRVVLAQTFAAFGPAAKDATPLLKEMLKDTDEKVRLEAAKALAHVEPGSKEAFAVLLPLLEEPRDVKGRNKLFEGLRVFHDLGPRAEPAVPLLVRLLDNPERGVVAYTVQVLGKVGPDARPAAPALAQLNFEQRLLGMPLIETLSAIGPEGDGVVDALIRQEAWTALGKMGPAARKASPRLLEVLRREPPPDPSLRPSTTTRPFAPVPAPILPREPQPVQPNPVVETRAFAEAVNAAIAYWRIERKSGPVTPILCAAAGSYLSGRQGTNVPDLLEVLAEIGPEAGAAVPALHRALDTYYQEHRVAIAYALWRTEGRAEVPVAVLADAMYDRQRYGFPNATQTAPKAAVALGKIGPAAKAAMPALLDASRSSYVALRTAAAEALRTVDPGAK
jgi:HEAT repeat protein